MRVSDSVSGLAIAALGALATYGGWILPPMPGQQIGPSVFPMVVGIGLVMAGLLVAIGTGRHYEDEAEADMAAIEGETAAADPPRGLSALWRLAIPPGLLIAYVLVVDRLGFAIAAAMVVFTAAVALGARLKLAVPLALLAPLAVHLVFGKLLRVALPPGLLPLPW